MQVRAHLRVTPTHGSAERPPAPARLKDAADALGSLGFTVLRVGRRGVSIEADARDFQDALGVPPPGPEGGSIKVRPSDRRLADLVDLIEVTPQPALLRR